MMAEADEAGLAAQRQMMLSMDPPQHDRFKLLVSRGFTPRNAQALTDRIAELAARDRRRRRRAGRVRPRARRRRPPAVGPDRRADGHPPRRRRAALRADRDHAHHRRRRSPRPSASSPRSPRCSATPPTVAERKRRAPGDDIASTLVQAEVDGDRLTDGEFQWFFLLLVNAGGDTTRNLLAAGIQLLFDHPDERARLLADLDGLLPTAIEEMLRYTSPVVHFRRTAMEDTVIARPADRRGRQGRGVLRLGQPRRGRVRRSRPLRRRPRPEPAHGVRRRRPAPVPRPARRPDRDRRRCCASCSPACPTSSRPGEPERAGVELHRRRAHDAGALHAAARRARRFRRHYSRCRGKRRARGCSWSWHGETSRSSPGPAAASGSPWPSGSPPPGCTSSSPTSRTTPSAAAAEKIAAHGVETLTVRTDVSKEADVQALAAADHRPLRRPCTSCATTPAWRRWPIRGSGRINVVGVGAWA